MLFIKRLLYSIIPKKLISFLRVFALTLSVKMVKNKDKIIFLLGVPKHGNLGDHAIIVAEQSFFEYYFPDFAVIQVPLYTYTNQLYKLKNIINNSIICISGGGSLGTLWMEAEDEIREIIDTFNNNAIFILPQTVYYENSEWGKSELRKSKEIYHRNEKLTLCAREKSSFEFFKKEFNCNNALFISDMVLYLKKDQNIKERDGILLCFRKDKESIMNDKNRDKLYELCKEYRDKVLLTDTVIPVRISNKTRERYLNEKLTEFQAVELVITDRLHGMIFAAITGTPCIALNNCNSKVKGVYEWIKHLNYVHYTEDSDDIKDYIGKLINLGGCTYDNSPLIQHYKELSDAIYSSIVAD